MNLRAQQRDDTRNAIIDAFLDLLEDGNPASVSMPAVAAAAGTSVRTVYRYFADKDELYEAAADHLRRKFTQGFGRRPQLNELPAFLTQIWGRFAEAIPAVRAQHLTSVGRELRAIRNAESRAHGLAGIEGLGLAVGSEDAERLADLVIAVSSSSMFLELVDHLGHPPDEAAELASFCVQAVIDRARRVDTLHLEGGVH